MKSKIRLLFALVLSGSFFGGSGSYGSAEISDGGTLSSANEARHPVLDAALGEWRQARVETIALQLAYDLHDYGELGSWQNPAWLRVFDGVRDGILRETGIPSFFVAFIYRELYT
jgi:hypothetical protein